MIAVAGMSDRQLAVLLNNYREQVLNLANTVEELVHKDSPQANEYVWIGEGKEPDRYTLAFWNINYQDVNNWEQQPVGDYLAVQAIREFAEQIGMDVDILQGKD